MFIVKHEDINVLCVCVCVQRWKRVWCVLYKESSCSISRLEFFECKDGSSVEKNERNLRKQQEHKKVRWPFVLLNP